MQIEICSLDASHQMTKLKFLHCVKSHTLTVVARRFFCATMTQLGATEIAAAPAVLPPGFEPLPPSKFSELLQKYPDTDYLVSFVGVPVLTPAQISQLPARRPQAVEVITCRAPARAMFANKVVCLAAMSRQVPDQSADGRPAQELFDAQYQIITPENTGALPH